MPDSSCESGICCLKWIAVLELFILYVPTASPPLLLLALCFVVVVLVLIVAVVVYIKLKMESTSGGSQAFGFLHEINFVLQVSTVYFVPELLTTPFLLIVSLLRWKELRCLFDGQRTHWRWENVAEEQFRRLQSLRIWPWHLSRERYVLEVHTEQILV